MRVPKFFRKMNCQKLLILFGGLLLVYSLYNYQQGKTLFNERLTTNDGNSLPQETANASVAPAKPLGRNAGYSSTTNKTDMHGLPPSCVKQEVIDPKDLLPKDKNSEWSKLNPMGGGGLKGVNLLQAGYHQGIDSVGQSLRNANLQLRSEPANPQMKVGPWNNSTMGPDLSRRPLEIGCGKK